jgi:ABC-type transport system substrate-binding protein
VDQLLEQGRKELDEAQRIACYREVERLVRHDVPWITQHYSVLDYLYQPYVQGVELSLLGKRAIPLNKIWLKSNSTVGTTKAMTDGESRP